MGARTSDESGPAGKLGDEERARGRREAAARRRERGGRGSADDAINQARVRSPRGMRAESHGTDVKSASGCEQAAPDAESASESDERSCEEEKGAIAAASRCPVGSGTSSSSPKSTFDDVGRRVRCRRNSCAARTVDIAKGAERDSPPVVRTPLTARLLSADEALPGTAVLTRALLICRAAEELV